MTKSSVDAQRSELDPSRASHFIEEGAAFMELAGLHASPSVAPATTRSVPHPTPQPRERERFDVIVIGGGQAGLSVGYHLAKRGLRFVILDANERIGDSWRKRWDSLRLFTPARYDGLDGMPFPADPNIFPTKDEMAAYLESYAARFGLPVRNGVKVERLSRENGRYLVQSGNLELEADQVVVAMANYQQRQVPAFAEQLDSAIVQLHSSEYRNPAQLRAGDVLIVGAGNSGAEIALELSRQHQVWMSGRDTGEIPFRIGGFWGRLLLVRLVLRLLFHRLLTIRTPMGRKLRPKVLLHGGPLIRTKQRDLLAMGVDRVSRVAGVRDGLPVLEDGRVLNVTNVIWSTGYNPGFTWIDLPIFDERGDPLHDGGVAKQAEGLYFVGLLFLYAMSSVMIHGVGRDAARIAECVTARARRTQAVQQRAPEFATV